MRRLWVVIILLVVIAAFAYFVRAHGASNCSTIDGVQVCSNLVDGPGAGQHSIVYAVTWLESVQARGISHAVAPLVSECGYLDQFIATPPAVGPALDPATGTFGFKWNSGAEASFAVGSTTLLTVTAPITAGVSMGEFVVKLGQVATNYPALVFDCSTVEPPTPTATGTATDKPTATATTEKVTPTPPATATAEDTPTPPATATATACVPEECPYPTLTATATGNTVQPTPPVVTVTPSPTPTKQTSTALPTGPEPAAVHWWLYLPSVTH